MPRSSVGNSDIEVLNHMTSADIYLTLSTSGQGIIIITTYYNILSKAGDEYAMTIHL